MPNKLNIVEKCCNLLGQWCNWIAVIGLVAMLLVTVIDVIGAKFFRWPLPGAVEGTALLGLVVTAFALPITQALRGHIEIEVIVQMLPGRLQTVISGVVSLLGLVLFAVMTWQMFDFSRTIQIAGRVTPTQEIPLYPFTYAVTVCFFLFCPMLLVQFLKTLIEGVKK